jgi:hypothetical protein
MAKKKEASDSTPFPLPPPHAVNELAMIDERQIRATIAFANSILYECQSDIRTHENEVLSQWKSVSRFAFYPNVFTYKNQPPDDVIARVQFPRHLWGDSWHESVMDSYSNLAIALYFNVVRQLSAGERLVDISVEVLAEIKKHLNELELAVANNQYSPARSPDEWERIFNKSWKTISRYISSKKIRAIEVHSKSWRIHIEDLEKYK